MADDMFGSGGGGGGGGGRGGAPLTPVPADDARMQAPHSGAQPVSSPSPYDYSTSNTKGTLYDGRRSSDRRNSSTFASYRRGSAPHGYSAAGRGGYGENTCPDPRGKAEICEDPESRLDKTQGKRPSKFVQFMQTLFRQRRRHLQTCDCIPQSLLSDDYYYFEEEELFEMAGLQMQELLKKKRDGGELTSEDLHWFTRQVASDFLEDSQIGAMLMAMCIRGLTQRETSALTEGIIATGDRLIWDDSWVTVDKHSTGGVGDKVSLVLAPALASVKCPCGRIKVPMLSGRGLGHTGGTLDKLESIPGFRVENSLEQLKTALTEAGCFIAGATNNIAPADAYLYAIRHVTSTVDSIPLVVASIISKKAAAGSKLLVMDIKVGNAAFFKSVDEAKSLAQEIIRVSKDLGITTKCIISKMENPIGKGIGNSLEVEDAIECMKGHGTPDLIELVAVTGAVILLEKGFVKSLEEGKAALCETLNDGRALESFRKMIVNQGVSPRDAEDLCKGYASKILPHVPFSQITPMRVNKIGTITSMNALELGTAVWKLGAGRVSPDEQIDYRVGIWLTHTVGDKVDVGDVWAEVHHAEPELPADIQKEIEDSITIEREGVVDNSLIVEIM